jgi:DNA-binding NarL/FixJ family response regulator
MRTTLLIVDDHPRFRATARALMEAEGFDVVGEAENGAAALAAFRQLRPRVVLLDVQLPDMDGFAVASQLMAANGSAPAIVLMSLRDPSDFGTLIASSGARGFVPKEGLSGTAVAGLVA